MAVPLVAKPHSKLKKYGTNVDVLRRPPYPIPLTDWQGDQESKTFYTGHLCAVGVEVREKKEMEALFSRGFFGKGSLSKSAPAYNRELPEGELRKMSRQRYERHRKARHATNMKDRHLRKEKVLVLDETKMTRGEDQSVNQQATGEIHIGKILDDPCPVVETLLLTFEEAFFLSYALGCLLILHNTGNYLTLKEMWNKFCGYSVDQQFPFRYAVYHHFRSKGWVVKSGLKFGANYILYKDGPPFNHASYSVMVQPVWNNSLLNCSHSRGISWQQIFGLNRVNQHAGKEVMICYVICPETATAADMQSPNIIKTLEVQEVLLRRWVAAEERLGSEEKSEEQATTSKTSIHS